MPDTPQVLALLVIGGAAAVFVAIPFLRREPDVDPRDPADPADELALRRELAYEELRDLEADRAAGSLDEATYRAQREAAEARAAAALAAIDARHVADRAGEAADRTDEAGSPPTGIDLGEATTRAGPRAALVIGSVVAAVLLMGFVAPGAPLANPTRVDAELAAALAREEERQAEIARLEERIAEDPRDAEAWSRLADAYLAGSSEEDLVRGATALLALLRLEPENERAFTRLITAYIRAGDYENAAAATEAFAEVAPAESPDLAFFRGIIALRRDGDTEAAVAAFDRFLELAPDDPRAGMVRTLRAEALGELPGATP